LCYNPFEAEYGHHRDRWQAVADVLQSQGYVASPRACQERTEKAIKFLKKKQAESKRASGIDEEEDEWTKLAEQVFFFQPFIPFDAAVTL
jgi:hypothetical protein